MIQRKNIPMLMFALFVPATPAPCRLLMKRRLNLCFELALLLVEIFRNFPNLIEKIIFIPIFQRVTKFRNMTFHWCSEAFLREFVYGVFIWKKTPAD